MLTHASQLLYAKTTSFFAAPPDSAPIAPDGLSDFGTKLIGWLKWGVLLAGVLGLLMCAGMLVIGRRNRNSVAQDGLIGSVWVIGGLAIASAAAAIVGAVLPS